MAQSKAHIKASNKYNAKAYDRLNIMVKKGQKEKIQERANFLGLSLNGYITQLIEKDMQA